MFKNFGNMFFEPDGSVSVGGTAEPSNSGQTTATEAGEKGDKTFTQEDINRIVVKEKDRAVRSVLKDLGFDDIESAKSSIQSLRTLEEDNTSALDKAIKAKEKAEKDSVSKAAEITQLKQQMELLKAGVKGDKLAEASAMIAVKLSDDTTYEEAVEKVKAEFPSLFNGLTGFSTTGANNNPPRKPDLAESYVGLGKRLAENRLKQNKISE